MQYDIVTPVELDERLLPIKETLEGVIARLDVMADKMVSDDELAASVAALQAASVTDPELKAQIDAVLAAIAKIPVGTAPAPTPTPTPAPPRPASGILPVGAGQLYKTQAEAMSVAKPGDTIEVHGVLQDQIGFGYSGAMNLTFVGKTPDAELKWTKGSSSRMSWGKGHIVAEGAGCVVKGLKMSGMAVVDNNGAGIRSKVPKLVVEDCSFENGQEGILAESATIELRRCKFRKLGIAAGKAGAGQTHCLYVQTAAKDLLIEDCEFYESIQGHQIKSRAPRGVIRRTICADLGADGSYNIDIPNGGEYLIENCVIEQGPNSPNRALMSYAPEGLKHAVNKLTIRNCIFIDDKSFGHFITERAGVNIGMFDIEGCTFVGNLPKVLTINGGSIDLSLKNKFFATRADAGLAAYPALPALPV